VPGPTDRRPVAGNGLAVAVVGAQLAVPYGQDETREAESPTCGPGGHNNGQGR
jgi:hypothetical protein